MTGPRGHAARTLDRARERVAGLRARVVRRRHGLRIWRAIVGVAGSVVIALGLIMLVIPGPGWVVIFLGLGIWATEFAWAKSLLAFAQRHVRAWTAWIARQPGWLAVLLGSAGLIVVAAIAWFWLA